MDFTDQPTPVQAALATKHGKEAQLGPALAPLGWQVEVVAVDTDALGTFSGVVPRTLAPLEVARRKALLAAGLAPEASWLLASEGSIATSPLGLTEDHELVVAVRARDGLVVAGRAASLDLHAVAMVVSPGTPPSELEAFCDRADLPRHHLIAVTAQRDEARVGLSCVEEVMEACAELGAGGSVHLETDLRAHCCPSRQPTIAAAARDLAVRIASPCPACGEPGFGDEAAELGLPCGACGSATEGVLAWRQACPSCGHGRRLAAAAPEADPATCATCNP